MLPLWWKHFSYLFIVNFNQIWEPLKLVLLNDFRVHNDWNLIFSLNWLFTSLLSSPSHLREAWKGKCVPQNSSHGGRCTLPLLALTVIILYRKRYKYIKFQQVKFNFYFWDTYMREHSGRIRNKILPVLCV